MKTFQRLVLTLTIVFFMTSCSSGTSEALPISNLTKKVAKPDDAINTASLPQSILDYITTNYSGETVRIAEKENNGNYEVTLSNNEELIFDANGFFLGLDEDGNNDYGDSNINPASLPQISLDYISTNYPNQTIIQAETENNKNYEATLNDSKELLFDSKGNFLSVVNGDDDGEGDSD